MKLIYDGYSNKRFSGVVFEQRILKTLATDTKIGTRLIRQNKSYKNRSKQKLFQLSPYIELYDVFRCFCTVQLICGNPESESFNKFKQL